MANLQESAVWEDGIYQWETEDPVVGGADGIDNVPTRQLANRTKFLKQQLELKASIEDVQKGTHIFATDTGVANTYVCNFTPDVKTRSEGQSLRFKVKTTNNGASTINDGIGIVPLVGDAHVALQGGELVAGGEALIQWNSTVGTGSYVLLSCTGASKQIANGSKSQHAATLAQVQAASGNKELVATILNGALTVTIPAGTLLTFRNPTLTDGSVINLLTVTPLSITVPSGATLGSASAVSASYAVVAIYNAGAPVLGIVNLNGGVDLSEQGLMSSSAIGVSSTSISTVYSSSDVTSSPYYVLGVLQATEPTAGVWSTVPTNVLGRGSNLVSSLGSIGYGQTWKNVLGSRVAGVTYYNTTGRPIMVNAAAAVVYTNDALKLTVNGVPIIGSSAASSNPSTYVSAIVPPGGSYVLSASNNGVNGINVLFNFVELR